MYSDNGDWANNCVSIFNYSNVSKDTDWSLIFFDSMTKSYINTPIKDIQESNSTLDTDSREEDK